MLAAMEGQIESVKILVENGAKVDFVKCMDDAIKIETFTYSLGRLNEVCTFLKSEIAKSKSSSCLSALFS